MLVFLAGFASAVSLSEWPLTSNGSGINVNADVTAGTFSSGGVIFNEFGVKGANAENWSLLPALDSSKYFSVSISPTTGNILNISTIDFDYSSSIIGPTSFELQYSKNADFSSPTSIVTKTDSYTTEKNYLNNGLNIVVNSGETLYFRWFGYDFDAITNEFFIRDLKIEGVVTPTPTFCSYDGGTSSDPGELNLDIRDVTVKSGLGDDEDWSLFDEIEVEVRVENDGDYDVDDISLEWGIADDSMTDWIIEMDEEKEFNLKDGKEESLILSFTINEKDLDVDFDELAENYNIYVRATGTIDDSDSPNDGNKTCEWDSQEVNILIDSDFVIPNKFAYTELVSCGGTVQLTADIWNIGDSDQDEVSVKIFNSELGINEKIEIGDLNAFSDEQLSVILNIPENAEEKVYYLKFEVYDEDDDIFNSDEFDEESSFFVPLTVQGGCASTSSDAIVSATLESKTVKAGQEVIIKATITNIGTKTASYTINIADYGDFASSAKLSKNTFTLTSGSSDEFRITLNLNNDATGENTFDIEVVSGNQLVTTQPVSINVESESLWGRLTGGSVSGGGSNLIWGIGFLNILLIVVIIIVAIKVAKR